MARGQTAPVDDRPWYYKIWFLIPSFIFGWPILDIPYFSLWPAWAILIIRSPWHTGFITGTLSWAMLMAGGVMIVVRLRDPDVNLMLFVVLIVPGFVVTGITQAHWTKHRAEYFQVSGEQAPVPQSVPGQSTDTENQSPRRRRRRRNRGRR